MARTSPSVQNLCGRGNLDSEGRALQFCKLAALKLSLPVTAHGTEVKTNISELRGGKKKTKDMWEVRGLMHSDAPRGQKNEKGQTRALCLHIHFLNSPLKTSMFVLPVIQLRPPNRQSLKKMVQVLWCIAAFVLTVHKVSVSSAFRGWNCPVEAGVSCHWLFKEYRKISLPRKGSKKLVHSWRLSPIPQHNFPLSHFPLW